MSSGRIIGLGATVLGFLFAVVVGLWLATQAASGELSTGGMLLGALLAFALIGPLLLFGIFMYVRAGQESEQISEMQKQRQLLDIVKSRGQVDIHNLAIEMSSNVDEIRQIVHQLVGLQVFTGYINWDKGTLYSTDAQQLRGLSECRNCGGQIKLSGKGIAVCPFCGTEYFL